MRDTRFIPSQSSGALAVPVLNRDQKKDLYVRATEVNEKQTLILTAMIVWKLTVEILTEVYVTTKYITEMTQK